MHTRYLPSLMASLLVLMLSFPHTASAGMTSLGDEELSSITAQSGVSIAISEGWARISYDSWYIEDTDHNVNWDTPETGDTDGNRIEFNDLVIDDGAGGYFSFASYGEPFTFDVGASPYEDDQTLISMRLSSHGNPRTLSVGNFVFLGRDIGSLALNDMTERGQYILLGPHGDGGCGIDFEYGAKMDIGAFEYTYNHDSATGDSQSLLVSAIHLCNNASGAPENPAAWAFNGTFRIGDFEESNPATFDVGSNPEVGKTIVRLNVPMKGSLRVENVSLVSGPDSATISDFGPCALDGIKVHRMTIDLVPGS